MYGIMHAYIYIYIYSIYVGIYLIDVFLEMSIY